MKYCISILAILFVFILGLITGNVLYRINHVCEIISEPILKDTVVTEESHIDFLSLTPEEGLMSALDYYNVAYPEIVYAQAVLETGHFKSKLCKEQNNLFGLYDSRNDCYYSFNHWSESIIAYKNLVQFKYFISENVYYYFLKNLPYAEDPNYINKLKKLIK